MAAEAPRRSQDPLPPRKRRPRTPDELPIVEEVIVPEPVKACPEAWRQIGEEVTELLDYEPVRFFKRRIVRPKYARRDHPYAAPIIAPLQTLQDRCVAAPGLIAAVIVGKYCDHLPLYRQQQIFGSRHDIHLPRQTMAQWMGLAADWLKPIYKHMRKEVLAAGYVQVDEPKRSGDRLLKAARRASVASQTPIEYLAPGHGETKLGYLWTCTRPAGDTIFHWETSRAAKCLDAVLPADWTGVVQCEAMPRIRHSPASASTATPSPSQDAGLMPDAPSFKHGKAPRALAHGCSTKSDSSMGSNASCAPAEQARSYAKPSEVGRARRSSFGSMLP